MTIIAHPDLTHLADAVRGRVWLPSDPGFDQAHRPWNRAVQQPVCAVVEAVDADDVARLVRFAGSRGLSVATQPTGHGATGRAADAILLRTSRLTSIEIARSRGPPGSGPGCARATCNGLRPPMG